MKEFCLVLNAPKEPIGKKEDFSPFPRGGKKTKETSTNKISANKRSNAKSEQMWSAGCYLTVQPTEAPLVSHHIPRSLQEMWSEKAFL
jgi:hypothetical protein